MRPEERKRLRIIAALILFLGGLFIVRLYYLQIIHGADFKKEADKQYMATVPNLYNRGNIYFQGKDGKLIAGATLNSGYMIAIKPKDVLDAEKTYATLAPFITLTHDEFIAKASKKDDPYEEIAHRIPDDAEAKLKKENLPGVHFFHETWRYYPGNSLAAQVLGFVGFKGSELVGRYGIESYYNEVLSRADEHLYINFFAELFSNLSDAIFDSNKAKEGDVVLTIEPTVQSYLETELQGVMDEWSSDEAGGVIMDPKTGAIYAMAVNPSFNLNQYGKVKDPHLFGNQMVEGVYEMGSIVKPITMASGIDAGLLNANTTYNDTGHITLNNKTFGNHDGKGRGPGTTMQKVLNDSLNTGVAFVVSKLGNQRFADYMLHKFHMGEETGIDLPGELGGLMNNLTSKRDIEYATASFGQGIAVTPINMASALATLGNGGYTVSPHVVDQILYTNGTIKKITPNSPEQVLNPKTSEDITRMLVTVVDKALLGGTVKIPEYSVAAKTGTAQVSNPNGGGYYDDRYFHTFFGYFPAYEPRFIVFMYTSYPKNGATFASHTLTSPFIRITKFLLHYYGVPPDRVGGAQGTTATLLR